MWHLLQFRESNSRYPYYRSGCIPGLVWTLWIIPLKNPPPPPTGRSSRPELKNPWPAFPKLQAGSFPGMQHSLLSQYFYFFCPTSICLLWRICGYVDISDCIGTVNELPLLPNDNTSETFLHQLGEAGNFTGYFSLGRRPFGDWVNTWHCTKRFKNPTIYRWLKCPNENQMTIPE
jgi:hypothetical protein